MKEENTICVDKCHKVFNNLDISIDKFREMYKEFRIGCCLRHVGIVEYKYFIRCDSPKAGKIEQEFHIIMELCDGGSLEQYLNSMPKKREVNI